jgi:hypothetical protein
MAAPPGHVRGRRPASGTSHPGTVVLAGCPPGARPGNPAWAGRPLGAGLGHLHELVEGQIEQVAALLVIDEHLGGAGHDLLHGVLIQPFAGDLGRLGVFHQDLLEAGGVALGLGDHALLVAVGLLEQAGGDTARLGNHVVGVGLAFVLEAFPVLAGLHRVVEGGLHLFRGLGVLHVELADVDAGLVAIQDVLHQLGGAGGDIGAALVEHVVHLALADDLAHGGLGRLLDGLVRIPVGEEVVFRILQGVLHGELQVDDVFVVGQHERLGQHLGLDAVLEAHFHGAYLLHVDHFHGLDRIGQMPARAGHGGFGVFTETQHDTALAGIDDIEAGGQPDQDGQADEQAGAAGDIELAAAADTRRRLVAATALAPEQVVQAAIEVLPEFIEIRRAATSCLPPFWLPHWGSFQAIEIGFHESWERFGGLGCRIAPMLRASSAKAPEAARYPRQSSRRAKRPQSYHTHPAPHGARPRSNRSCS